MEKPMKTTGIPYINNPSPKSQKQLPYEQTSNRSQGNHQAKKVYLTAMNKIHNNQQLSPASLVRMQPDRRNLNDKNIIASSIGDKAILAIGKESPPRTETADDLVLIDPMQKASQESGPDGQQIIYTSNSMYKTSPIMVEQPIQTTKVIAQSGSRQDSDSQLSRVVEAQQKSSIRQVSPVYNSMNRAVAIYGGKKRLKKGTDSNRGSSYLRYGEVSQSSNFQSRKGMLSHSSIEQDRGSEVRQSLPMVDAQRNSRQQRPFKNPSYNSQLLNERHVNQAYSTISASNSRSVNKSAVLKNQDLGRTSETFVNSNNINVDSERTSTTLPVCQQALHRLESLKNDEQKIQNRVNLLMKEEQRIMKKIDETRARAQEITHLRQKNEQAYIAKLNRKKEAEEEQHQNRHNNAFIKQMHKKRLEQVTQTSIYLKHQEASELKQLKEMNRERIHEQKVDILAMKIQRAGDVREQNKRQKQMRDMDMQARIEAGRTNIQRRVMMAEQQSKQRESSIAQLEKQEAEMLNRIKNSQNLQLKVFNKLEQAMYQQQFPVNRRMENSPEALAINRQREEIENERRGSSAFDAQSGNNSPKRSTREASAQNVRPIIPTGQGVEQVTLKTRPPE